MINEEQIKKAVPAIITIIVIIVVIIILKKLLGKGGLISNITTGTGDTLASLGIGKSSSQVDTEKKTNALSTAGNNNPFNPLYYKNHSGNIMTAASGDTLATDIYDSVGIFIDEPSKALNALKQCSNKNQISFVAERFNNKYGKDLFAYLTTNFDTTSFVYTVQPIDYLTQMLDYANSLS